MRIVVKMALLRQWEVEREMRAAGEASPCKEAALIRPRRDADHGGYPDDDRLRGVMSETQLTGVASTKPSAAKKPSPGWSSRFHQGGRGRPGAARGLPDRGPRAAEEHLRLFLMQYSGGPATYNQLRGHPRLRMRHVRFHIGETERDLWLKHMRTALDEARAARGA